MAMPRVSLRNKVLIAFLVVLLPMLALIIYDYGAEYSRLTGDLLDDQLRLSRGIAALVNTSMDDALAIAWSFSKNPVVQSGDPRQIDSHLRSLEPFLPPYDDVAVFDLEGRNVGSMKLQLQPGVPRPGVADRQYYQAVKATGRPFVSNVLISRSTGRPVAAVAVPMLDGRGTVTGVTVVALNMDNLVESISTAGLAGSQSIFMTDPEGSVAFHTGLPREEWGRRSLADYGPVRLALGGVPGRELAVAGPLGDEWIVATAPVPGYGWVVGVSVPMSAALRPMRDALVVRLLVYAATVLFAGLVAILLTRRLILGPLGSLTDHLAALGRGRLERRLELRTGDEMEAMARTANQMAAQLQEWSQERETLVQESVRARRAAEESAELARRGGEELQELLASLTEGVTIVDETGKVILMNEVGRRIWKLLAPQPTPDEYRRLDLRYPDGRPMPFEEWPINRARRGERFAGYEVLYLQEGGRALNLSFSGSAVLDETGRVKMAINVYRDVTRLRELEQQREDYVRIVAHDLRAPLTIIQGQAQLLRRDLEKDGLDGRAWRSVEAVLTGARRMNSMIQDLVDSVRLEAGQLRLEKQPVELGSFVSDLLGRAAGVLDIGRVRTEIPKDLPLVDADPDRLERILINLLSNALKYSPAGTEVVVGARRADREVLISVSDRGSGIDPEDLPHVFERFYRARGARKTEGLGLGLYITRMLIEAQGGWIRVESAPGKGSSFSFTLPASRR